MSINESTQRKRRTPPRRTVVKLIWLILANSQNVTCWCARLFLITVMSRLSVIVPFVPDFLGLTPFTDYLSASKLTKLGIERVQACTRYHFAFALCCHSNATRSSIANPPNSVQLQGHPYHSPHPGPCNSVGMRTRTDRQTHTDTRVTTIHSVPKQPLCFLVITSANEHQFFHCAIPQEIFYRSLTETSTSP